MRGTLASVVFGAVLGFAGVTVAQECVTSNPTDGPTVYPGAIPTVTEPTEPIPTMADRAIVYEDGSFTLGDTQGCIMAGLCAPTDYRPPFQSMTLDCRQAGPCSLHFQIHWPDGSIGTYSYD